LSQKESNIVFVLLQLLLQRWHTGVWKFM